jgi:5,10-methylenetetrahydromethanopterin reductase
VHFFVFFVIVVVNRMPERGISMKACTQTPIPSFGLSLPANFDAPRQAQRAEDLGFSFIGFFDSPALEPDVWITIANAVQRTRRIQVGTEVLVPHLRHPMAQAAAIATIDHLAPGRLYVGVGTGFTGRMAMGQRPLRWAFVSRFVKDP